MSWRKSKLNGRWQATGNFLTVVVFLLPMVHVLPSVAGLVAPEARLWGGSWDMKTWGFQDRGFFSLIIADSDMRLEISESTLEVMPDRGLLHLWRQDVPGWTVVAGIATGGTLNAWGREWRPLDSARLDLLAHLARELPALTAPGPDMRPKGVSFVVRPTAKDGQLSPFHRNLVTRGLGQGGLGEIVTFSVVSSSPSQAEALTLELKSSRRPGSVTLTFLWSGLPLGEMPLDLFTPFWSLENFLEFPALQPELPDSSGVESDAVRHGG